MVNLDKAYIVTYTGKKFHLLEPRIEDIDIEDIAHSLSQQCRWTGHTRHHYSIAQHGYYCSFLGPKNEAFHRLNHDDSEAYVGDMNRPLKHYTEAGPPYRKQEDKIQAIICDCFGMSHTPPPSVHTADEIMLYTEKAQIMASTDFEMSNPWKPSKVADITIEEWTPKYAKRKFLERFQELYQRRIN